MAESTEEEVIEHEGDTGDDEPSLRDTLEEAVVEAEKEETDEDEEETGDGEKTGETEEDDPEAGKDKGGKAGEGETETESIGNDNKRKDGINAPIGFTPESREQWKDVPETVKADIQKREKEITAAMSHSAESRRTHDHMTKLGESYATVLAAEGVDTPIKAVESLFRTVAELRMGTPQQTATKMAGLIKHYNIDIGILDSVLSGDMSAQNTDDSRLAKILDDRLAPVQDLLRTNAAREKATAAAAQAAVNDELKKFAGKAEFLNDVRDDMADLIDLASKRGHKMGFDEAYKKACAMHPTISGIMEKRVKDEALKNSGEKLKGKRNAASSIRQSTGSVDSKSKTLSLRGEISSAWDAQTE